MENLKCIKCGEESHTNKEFITGKCRFCGGELEEESWSEGTEDEHGIDRYDY